MHRPHLTVGAWSLQESGLGEDMKVHKSQLERDRDAAVAAQAARKKAGVNPATPYPHKVCSLLLFQNYLNVLQDSA